MKQYKLREPIPKSAGVDLAGYPEIIRSLLYYRGVDTKEKAHDFLNPHYEAHLHDPFLLKDMDKAVERIEKAIAEKERILIYSDYDADGIPAAVVLKDFFKLIGYQDVEVYIPHRHTEGYGLHFEAIESFKTMGVKLMITLDCGIVDHAEVARAHELGIDVIITDHHVPSEKIPEAYAVVNPKRADCEYPFKHLCGAGVAFKLVQALVSKHRTATPSVSASEIRALQSDVSSLQTTGEQPGHVAEKMAKQSAAGGRPAGREPFRRQHAPAALEHQPLVPGKEKWLLDMVGLATLSDMVPLVGENRVLAHYGLKVLRKSRRPGLSKLLSIMNVNKQYLTEDDVGFMITPRINAASRMGIPIDAFHLLSTDVPETGEELAKHLDKINNERKGLVAVTVKEIKKLLADRDDHFRDKKVIVLGNPLWRPALLGLVANSIAEEYNKPVFLWGREDGKDIKGSCRSDGSVHLVKLMEHARLYFMEFGGHAYSGGFSVHPDLIHTLEDGLNAAFRDLGHEAQVEEPVLIDAKLSLDEVTPRLFDSIDKLAPFGMENPKPVFMFRNVIPADVKMFGKAKDHLELSFFNSTKRKIKAIGFFMKAEDFSAPPKQGIPLSLVATLEKSYFGRSPELRLRIVDIL